MKKKKKVIKKLVLPKETIRVLDHRDLADAVGGGTRNCPVTSCNTNPRSTCM